MLEYILKIILSKAEMLSGLFPAEDVNEISDNIFPIVHPIPTVLQTHGYGKVHICRYLCTLIDSYTDTHTHLL